MRYLEDTYLFEHIANVIARKQDERGLYVLLDQTIFYPQGGGQPSDHGTINGKVHVIHVRQADDGTRHYIDQEFAENKVVCVLDKERRMLNARYHTAAHLLGNVVETLNSSLKAVKGHSFPGEAYVEFLSDDVIDQETLQDALNQAIASNAQTKVFDIDQDAFEETFYKLPYDIPGSKGFRAVQIGTYLPVPCGGTHVACIGEIGKINVGKMKSKKGILRISYDIAEPLQ